MKRKLQRLTSWLEIAVLIVPTLLLGHAAAICLEAGPCTTTTSDSSTLFGQTQSYDVLLRGNGEAVVNARLSFSNNEAKQPLSSLKYEVTSGHLEEVTAFQEVACGSLPIIEPLSASSPSSSPVAGAISPSYATNTATTTDVPECYQGMAEHPLDSASPLAYYYPSQASVYKKVSVKQSGNSFTLSLPQALKNSQSTTIVMAYSQSAVSHKSGGVFHYDFKTLKSSSSVSDVSVAVSVDEDFFLADAAKSNVNYRVATSNSIGSSVQAGVAQTANSAAASNVNNYVDSIGSNGSISRHASSLAPNETYTVDGRFASSTFLLNWPRTVLRWAILLLVIVLIIYWYIRNRRKLQASLGDSHGHNVATSEAKAENVHSAEASVSTHQLASTSVRALPFYNLGAHIKRHLHERRVRPMFFAWTCGILAILLLAGVLVAFSALSNVNNTYASNGSGNSLVAGLYIGLAALGFLGFLFLTVGLPILYAGSFKGALRIYAHLIVFFVVVGIVLVTLAVKLGNDSNSVGPAPGGCDGAIGCCGYYSGATVCNGAERGIIDSTQSSKH